MNKQIANQDNKTLEESVANLSEFFETYKTKTNSQLEEVSNALDNNIELT